MMNYVDYKGNLAVIFRKREGRLRCSRIEVRGYGECVLNGTV